MTNPGTEYTNPNSALVNRCKNGDRKAFYELYTLYAKAMYNISFRILNNKDEADDVLQDSFLKAFQNIKGFDGKVSFGIWLKRIIINRSVDIVRKQKHTFFPLEEALYVENEEEEEEIIYDIDSVKKSIQELSPGYRIVLTLYLLEDYSHKDIAVLLNISEGTSKSQYSRAKKQLIKLVKEKTPIRER